MQLALWNSDSRLLRLNSGHNAIFDAGYWAAVPFQFWSLVFFVFGCMVGSFLNVCIHRLPLGMSIVTPPSHCPHCKYSIPWWLNIPLVTWLALRGRCKNCGAPISPRYFIVELLTGLDVSRLLAGIRRPASSNILPCRWRWFMRSSLPG